MSLKHTQTYLLEISPPLSAPQIRHYGIVSPLLGYVEQDDEEEEKSTKVNNSKRFYDSFGEARSFLLHSSLSIE